MPHRTPADWHALAAELERLLSEGQPGPIRLLLQARFLREIQGESASIWSAFAFPVALSMVQHVDGELARYGAPTLGVLEETLGALRNHAAPPWACESTWAGALEAAHARLAEQRDRLQQALREGGGIPAVGVERVSPAIGTGRLLIPVILEVAAGREVPEIFRRVRAACLLCLTVEAQLLYRRAATAELTILGAIDAETLAAFEEGVRLVARSAPAGTPSLGHYWFRARWDLPGARLTGRSATLGFLLAAQSAHRQFSLGLDHRDLSDGVAVTGDLREGAIAPVESIPEKVEACFYGGVRVMVVPSGQREEALREVRRLEEQHPGRQLLVLGAGDPEALRREPTVTVVRMRTGRELLRATWRRLTVSRALVAALIGVFMVLAGLVGREVWLQRPWPVEIRWERDHLVFQNASGRDYHRLPLPPGAPPGEVGQFQRRAARVAAVCDLDGGSTHEAVAVCWNPGFDGNSLRAWDGRGRARWSLSSQLDLEGSPFAAGQLNWRCFVDLKASHAQVGRLLAVRRSRYGSLSLVDLIDSPSGRRLGSLANQGHLGIFLEVDVDGDGAREILVIGTENRLEAGVVVILDPGRIESSSVPGLSDPVWLTEPTALEHGVRAALLFPRDRLRPVGRPECVDGQMENGLLRVTTETEGPWRAIIFSLDLREISRPRAVGALLNDSYRQRLAASVAGMSTEEMAAAEDRLVREISYLTPEGWRPVPFEGESGEIDSARGARRD